MSKLKSKIPLFVLFFSVTGYALYEYRKSLKEEGGEKEGHVPFLSRPFNDAVEVHLKKPDLSLSLIKKDGDWRLKKPVEDWASSTALSKWYDALGKERVRPVAAGSGPIDWGKYDLKEGAVQVEIVFSDQAKEKFLVSARPAFDGRWFVRWKEGLFLGSQNLGGEVKDKSLEAFRSKKLLRSTGHPVKARFQKRGSAPLVFVWDKFQWDFPSDKSFPLDRSALRSFWMDLSSLQALSVEKPASPSHLKKRKLFKNPFISIHLSFGENQKQTVSVSALKDGAAFAHASGRDFILKIGEEDFKSLLLSKHKVRDHGHPFRFSKEQAFRIKVSENNQISYIVEKEESSGKESLWRLVSWREEPKSLNAKKSASPGGKETLEARAAKKTSGGGNASKLKETDHDGQGAAQDDGQDVGQDAGQDKGEEKTKEKRAQSEEVNVFLNSILELKGQKYRKGRLKPSGRTIEIQDKDGALVFSLQEGHGTKDKEKLIWVRTSIGSEQTAVLENSLNAVFNKKLVQ